MKKKVFISIIIVLIVSVGIYIYFFNLEINKKNTSEAFLAELQSMDQQSYIDFSPQTMCDGWFYFFVTLLNQFYWVASATIGGVIGSLLKFDTSGISFVMTAMFVVIFLDQWMKEKIHLSSMIGILVSLVCLILFGADSFMIPTMILIVLLLTVLRKWLEQYDKLKEKEEPTK